MPVGGHRAKTLGEMGLPPCDESIETDRNTGYVGTPAVDGKLGSGTVAGASTKVGLITSWDGEVTVAAWAAFSVGVDKGEAADASTYCAAAASARKAGDTPPATTSGCRTRLWVQQQIAHEKNRP
jgi:hypothetical protein